MVLLCNNIAIASTVASTSLASGSLFTAIYLQLLHPEYLLGTAPEIVRTRSCLLKAFRF